LINFKLSYTITIESGGNKIQKKIFGIFLSILIILTFLQIRTSATKITSGTNGKDMNLDNSPPNKPIIRVPDTIQWKIVQS
jgi:hypothetical protein